MNWPNQERAFTETTAAIKRGVKRIVVTSPTGSGKGLMLQQMIEWARERFLEVAIYIHRRLLFDQTAARLESAGISFGKLAAGHEESDGDVQLCMIQTEHARKHKKLMRPAQVVIVDEAHLIKGDVAQRIFGEHLERGAVLVGYTATPLDLADVYEHLIVAGTNSEMRACGAIVPAMHYGCDEPDWKILKQAHGGADFTAQSLSKAFAPKRIFGRVLEWYRKLNPDQKPALLFAPGVKESVWFAESFTANGIPAASIDGDDIWLDGKSFPSSHDMRERTLDLLASGDIKVICNRFVLREGIDLPCVEHGILATAFGSLTSYIQSCGRLLRAFPGKEHAIIADHGGSWHRHGSINANRNWTLDSTAKEIATLREMTMRDRNEKPGEHLGKDGEPVCCPKCHKIRRTIIGQDWRTCDSCGYRASAKARPVIQSDGNLKIMQGDIYKPRRRRELPNDQRDWERMYYRAKHKDMTFLQMEALFAYEHNWTWPRRDMKYMPLAETDWLRTPNDVPSEALRH